MVEEGLVANCRSGKLFVIPTPVGNLSDMAPRSIEILKMCDLILCEDTRTSGVLMKHFSINTPLRSYHKFNEHQATASIMEMLKSGSTIALVSDAGTPAISDPGFMLTRECRREGITIETVPGPTALIPALVNSGLPCERFTFEGFLPVKKGRVSYLTELAQQSHTMVIYESPVRLTRTLKDLADVMGGTRQSSVSREISKVYNTTVNGTLDELLEYFSVNQAKGEIVIVVKGKSQEKSREHKNKYKTEK